MLFDLHTHSTVSDGTLPVRDLIARARAAGIDVLAITDHDSIAGYEQLEGVDLDGLTLLAGVELSAQWRHTSVHIVGLNVRLADAGLREALARQRQARLERAELIAAKLAAKGFNGLLPQIQTLADNDCIGRPHFALALVEIGAARTLDDAFNKYLGAGRLGDLKHCWAPLAEVVRWIRDAGGTPVLAHPDKYALTRTKLNELVDDFADAGGQALEVVSGRQEPYKSKELAVLCQRRKLLASCGSDFHRPGQSWADLGRHSPLPANCTPVWDHW